MSKGNPILTREEFLAIQRECLNVLEEYGVVSRVPAVDNPGLREQFSSLCEDFFTVDEGGGVQKIDSGINQEKIDLITLKWAIILARHGAEGVRYRESLNGIRIVVADVIEEMGFKRISDLTLGGGANWLLYPLWDEVARLDGGSEEEIRAAQEERRHSS